MSERLEYLETFAPRGLSASLSRSESATSILQSLIDCQNLLRLFPTNSDLVQLPALLLPYLRHFLMLLVLPRQFKTFEP